MKKASKIFLLLMLILIPLSGHVDAKSRRYKKHKYKKSFVQAPKEYPNPHNTAKIVIDKESYTLKVYNINDSLMKEYPVGLGINYGNKRRKGDHKTPEGEFTVKQIQNSSGWTHDFRDGKGKISGAYGPWFIRLATPPFTTIGIHGTHDPASIGTRCSEGCIRLHNEDVAELKEYVHPGLKVIILPGKEDLEADDERNF